MATRIKKPMALRELHGTANRNKQRNNTNAPKPKRGIGPPPEHLSAAQARAWDYLVSVMFEGVLGESDRPTMEILACLFARFRAVNYDDLEAKTLSGTELAMLQKIMASYGMSPADREKITVEKQEEKNPFAQI